MDLNDMTMIKLYELHYITRDFFLEQILGCGQRTIAEEGIDRFMFYLDLSAGRTENCYYIAPYA